MTPAAVDEARAAVAAAALLAQALPGSASADALLMALAECDVRLHGAPDSAAVLAGMENAASLAIMLCCEGALPAAALDALARARNETLGAVHDPTLARIVAPPRAVPLLMASRALPQTRPIEHEPFTPSDGAPRASADEPLTLSPEPSNDVDAVDDGDAAGAPAAGRRSDPWKRPVRDDWRPEEGVQSAHPPVRLARVQAVTSPREFYGEMTREILEVIAVRARERMSAPLDVRDEVEASILILTDALLATGGACVASIAGWWSQSIELDDPWTTWAAVFSLGSIAGTDTADAVRRGLEALSQDAAGHAASAAAALAVVPHPDRSALAADLLGAAHPVARAVGVELSSHLGGLSGDALARQLLDPNLAVMSAALRAATRVRPEDVPSLAPVLERLVEFPHPEVAWLSARRLLAWGNRRPYSLARSGGRILSVLGARVIEVFVLAGGVDDLAILERIVKKVTVTPATLSSLARFGHPGIWAYLVHHLANEELVDDAAEALVEIFGTAVPAGEQRRATAWRQALLRMRPDPTTRYRRGEPWRPSAVADECLSGRLSARRVELRLHELAARAGLSVEVNPSLWMPDVRPALQEIGSQAHRTSRTWPAPGWR